MPRTVPLNPDAAVDQFIALYESRGRRGYDGMVHACLVEHVDEADTPDRRQPARAGARRRGATRSSRSQGTSRSVRPK